MGVRLSACSIVTASYARHRKRAWRRACEPLLSGAGHGQRSVDSNTIEVGACLLVGVPARQLLKRRSNLRPPRDHVLLRREHGLHVRLRAPGGPFGQQRLGCINDRSVVWVCRVKRRGSIECQLVDMAFAKGSAWLVRLDDLDDGLAVYQRGDVDCLVSSPGCL